MIITDSINSEAQATFLLANCWFFLSVSVKNLLALVSHAKIFEQIKKNLDYYKNVSFTARVACMFLEKKTFHKIWLNPRLN